MESDFFFLFKDHTPANHQNHYTSHTDSMEINCSGLPAFNLSSTFFLLWTEYSLSQKRIPLTRTLLSPRVACSSILKFLNTEKCFWSCFEVCFCQEKVCFLSVTGCLVFLALWLPGFWHTWHVTYFWILKGCYFREIS